ncbi:MAG: hypothetical protein DWQ01_11650 [Planctomycetota bacterium]|nr:MAG: hypothetical protein DWQ01_11650 [Planctomycetota bacterium]
MLAVLAVVVLVAGGGGYWFFFMKDQPVEAGEDGTEVTAPEGTSPSQPEAGDGGGQSEPATPTQPAESGESGESQGGSDPEPAKPTEPAPDPEPEPVGFKPPEPGETIQYRGITDFNELDLGAVSEIERWPQCPQAEWDSLVEDLDLFLEDAGAVSNRAGLRLQDAGRPAFPILVNGMLRQDFSTKDGNRTAAGLNKLITEIGQGTNLGWKTTDTLEEGTDEFLEAGLFNKKITAMWYNSWVSKFAVDDAQWDGFASDATKKNEASRKDMNKKESPMDLPPISSGDMFDD